MEARVENKRVEKRKDGREVFRYVVVVVDDAGEVVNRGHYRRHLTGSFDGEDPTEYLQSRVDEQKEALVEEARNRDRIDPGAIS